MKIKLSNLVKLLDKNYEELARKLTREQILALDRLTTDIEYKNRGDEHYYPEAKLADELGAACLGQQGAACLVALNKLHAPAMPSQ